jgi:transaldolase
MNETPHGDTLRALSDEGVAVWLDGLTRDRIRDGGLASLIRRRSVVGAAINPVAFHKALNSKAYQEQLDELAAHGGDEAGGGDSGDRIVRALLAADAREACDALLPTFEATGGIDGLVSVDLLPASSPDDDDHLTEAALFRDLVDRPNLLVGIPATAIGLTAITSALAAGIGVNAGPVFSPTAYRAVADAFLAGLEQAAGQGLDPSAISSVASFALSHIDTEVDKRLWAIGTDRSAALRGRTAVAMARSTHAIHEEEVYSGERWKRLAAAHAKPQRLLWTATIARDPYYSETLYVDTLVGPGVANAMSEATLGVVAESARITGDTLHGAQQDDAKQTLAELEHVGVDLADVAQTLEASSIERYRLAWHTLSEAVARSTRR